jgi:hypothetical protein
MSYRRGDAAMDRQLVDQTASELELHRVLWLIKFLRAMVLHVLLASAAIAAVLPGRDP